MFGLGSRSNARQSTLTGRERRDCSRGIAAFCDKVGAMSQAPFLSYEQLIARGFTIEGTPEADVLEGTSATDTIDALEGDDAVIAKAGDDTVTLGAGDDIADAGEGNDVVFGGEGNDRLFGEDGSQISRSAIRNAMLYAMKKDSACRVFYR